MVYRGGRKASRRLRDKGKGCVEWLPATYGQGGYATCAGSSPVATRWCRPSRVRNKLPQ